VATLVAGHSQSVTGQEASRPKIAVVAYDYSGISATVMASARQKVNDVFEKAGVDIIWSAPLSSANESGDGRGECPQPFLVQVMIRTRNAEWEPGRKRIMGVTLVGDGERALLSLFYDAIFDVARRYGTPLDEILTVALAHEMGHALLPSPSHASTGVMQAKWEGDDIRLAVGGLLAFDQGQAEIIRAKAQHRCAVR